MESEYKPISSSPLQNSNFVALYYEKITDLKSYYQYLGLAARFEH